MKEFSMNNYNGWTIADGDYIRHKDKTALHFEKIMKRKKITERTIIAFGSFAIVAALIIVLAGV